MRAGAGIAYRQAPGADRCISQRLQQTRNAAAPYITTSRAPLMDGPSWPGHVNSLQIKRALALLEEGEGLQFIPAAHRTHTIAGAFMALTGDALHEVERQCARIGQALASMGVNDWQIAALTVDGIKQCHYRLAHRTITMAQLANHIIQYGTRAVTMMLPEVPHPASPPVRPAFLAIRSARSALPPGSTAGPTAMSRTVSAAVQPATSQTAPPPRYRNIIPRPTIMPPSEPRPPQQ